MDVDHLSLFARQVVNQNNANTLLFSLSIYIILFSSFYFNERKVDFFFFLKKIFWKRERKGYLSLAKIIPHIHANPFQLTKSCWQFKPNVSQSICRSPLLTS